MSLVDADRFKDIIPAEGIDITEWAKSHEPDENLIWKSGMWDQVLFLRDHVNRHLVNPYHEDRSIDFDERMVKYESWRDHGQPVVVSSHTSKSVMLPVVRLSGPHFTLITRGNFFNWICSIESKFPVVMTDDMIGLVGGPITATRGEGSNPVYAEGFKRDWVYGAWIESNTRFTLELPYNKYVVWAFFYLLSRQFRDSD